MKSPRALNPNEKEILASIVRDCYSSDQIVKPTGEQRAGFFNLKRIYGFPDSFRQVVSILAPFLTADAICAPDVGASPLVGALGIEARLPSIYVREQPKYYYLSYGLRQAANRPQLFGDALPERTAVQIVDDVLHDGVSVLHAASILRDAGLVVQSVLCILSIYSDDSALRRIQDDGIKEVMVLLYAASLLKQ